ncbi:universal stress protein [Natronorarus salvus]|uniref:universal stress protein n=1 Tax=Natronorarus salvus TaxID=3117733 RepID=UPI002F25FBA7
MSTRSTLIPVDLQAAETVPEAVYDLVGSLHVVLFGYYPVPEQTPPAQAREAFGEDAGEHLETLAREFAARGVEVESVVVFTPDPSETIERVATDRECHSITFAGRTDSFDRVLVPIRGGTNLLRILEVTARLADREDLSVMLLNVAGDDRREAQATLFLRGAKEWLVDEEGVDPARIDTRIERSGDPVGTIVSVAAEFDAVVIGETKPSIRTLILGDLPRKVLDRVDCTVIVVRRDRPT